MITRVPLRERRCCKCGEKMERFPSCRLHAVRCKKLTCRKLIRRADCAYTIPWLFVKGRQLSYKNILNAVHVYSHKTAQDQVQHFLGAGRDATKNIYPMLRCAAAYAELHEGRSIEVGDGTTSTAHSGAARFGTCRGPRPSTSGGPIEARGAHSSPQTTFKMLKVSQWYAEGTTQAA